MNRKYSIGFFDFFQLFFVIPFLFLLKTISFVHLFFVHKLHLFLHLLLLGNQNLDFLYLCF